MEYYRKVPKSKVENLKFRKHLIEGADSEMCRQAIRKACREDILFWVNAFCWTFDPREPDTMIPFITYPFQDDAILTILECMRKGQQLVMQKSRDMGASWMSVLTMDHQATFEESKRFVMMSYQADLVDKKGNPKSLFWKLDKIHEFLPTWLAPRVDSRLLGREYVSSGSTVDGVATTEVSNIGDRATAIFIDEFSKYDVSDADAMLSGLADVSPCRIWNFTKNTTVGKVHPSYTLVDQWQRGYIRGLRMHWTQHPLKNRGLYKVDKNTGAVEVIDKNVYQIEKRAGEYGIITEAKTGYEFPTNYKFQKDNRFEWHSIAFDYARVDRANDRYMSEQWEIDDDGSSYTVFDVDIVNAYIAEHCRAPLVEGVLHHKDNGDPEHFEVVRGGPIKLWLTLDGFGRPPEGMYGAGADLSLGSGATNSCLTVGSVTTGQKVLELATPTLRPDAFAVLTVAICRWFRGDVLLVWEKQGPGETFGKELVRMNYNKVWMEMKENQFTRKQTRMPGWSPNKSNAKEHLLSRYRSALSKRDFLNPSRIAMLETLDWIDTGKGPVHKDTTVKGLDPSGAAQNHGDRVIADALCWKMIEFRGGGSKHVVTYDALHPPIGTLEHMMMMEERASRKNGTLYPNWRG